MFLLRQGNGTTRGNRCGGVGTGQSSRVDSHGVARLTAYVNKFREGGFKPDPEMTIESGPSRGTFSVDGDGGPGQTAGQTAMQTAIERAAEMGMAAGVVRNSNHFGTAAFYTELAAEHDCIGIAMTNVGPDVVPFNGTKPYFGTNPISFAIPTHRSYPITLDMATSVVAMGKIDHVAKETDASIPDHWGRRRWGADYRSPRGQCASPIAARKGTDSPSLSTSSWRSLRVGAEPDRQSAVRRVRPADGS
ncbi:hypothetical protein D8S78_21930 [Natrialba swarupiae]|nr:hypothetical protein [Natrialba swarupiae]